MKKLLRVSAILFFFYSCSGVMHVSSNKDSSYNQSLSKVFIEGDILTLDQEFGNEYCALLAKTLNEKNIQSSYITRGKLALNSEADIQKAITDFNPSQIIHIKFKGEALDSIYVSYSEIAISDVKTKTVIWKGLERYDSYGITAIKAAGRRAVNLTVKKLTSDALLN